MNTLKREQLATLRKAAGLTQQELARKSGLDGVTISRYERGLVTPGLANLQRIADALGVSVDAFEVVVRPRGRRVA